jgi:hypothetical protein
VFAPLKRLLLLRDYAAPYSRRLSSSYSPPWEPEISLSLLVFNLQVTNSVAQEPEGLSPHSQQPAIYSDDIKTCQLMSSVLWNRKQWKQYSWDMARSGRQFSILSAEREPRACMIDETYIECIKERVEGGNLVPTLKFFSDQESNSDPRRKNSLCFCPQSRHQQSLFLCSHEICTARNWCVFVVTQVVRW